MGVRQPEMSLGKLLDRAEARPAIPGYRILGRLGQGGQGAVFLAERVSDGRRAAIKVLLAGVREARRRFLREIALSRSFAHPNVVKILDGSLAGEDGDPWLAMEYLEGQTLADALGEGPLGEARVRSLARDMARGLEYLHGRGLVHRDLKPANVFLESEGRAILLDFGLATGDELTRMTATSDIPGTFVAMAPEQLQCKPLTPATDVYQLGFTLFVALTGQPPFSAEEIVRGISTGEWAAPPSPRASSDCSEELAALVVGCLQADAGRRPSDGAAVLAALQPREAPDEPAQPGGRPPTHRLPASGPLRLEPPRSFRRILGGGLLALGLAGVVLALRSWGGPDGTRAVAPVSSSPQAELLAACYGGPGGPDPLAVTAVLRELDAVADPTVDPELRSSLAQAWRNGARALAEDDPARALVEAALHLREGAREKAAAALQRALEGQRLLLKERSRVLTDSLLVLEAGLLARWAGLAVEAEEPRRVHGLLDEGDRFVVALPETLAVVPAASTLRLVSLAARWVLWGRQGAPGAASREDAATGLAAFAVGRSVAELAALPRWCVEACQEAASAADPALLDRCGHAAGARELAAQVCVEAREASRRLNEINHDVRATAGLRMAWVVSVAEASLRRLRRLYWLALALARRPETEPAVVAALCQVSSDVVEIRLRGRLSDLAVAGRWGEGFEPDVLLDGAMAAMLRVLASSPGLAGDEAAAAGLAEWWVRSSLRPGVAVRSRARLGEALAERPLLQAMVTVVAASCTDGSSPREEATAELLRRGRALLEDDTVLPSDRSAVCTVLAEGFRRGWFVLPSAQQSREAAGQATWLMEALDAEARGPGAAAPVRRLWTHAVMVVANGRLAEAGSAGAAAGGWPPLEQRLGDIVEAQSTVGGDEAVRKAAAELLAGRAIWPVVGAAPE